MIWLSPALLLAGCASTPGYAPRTAFPIDADIKQLHAKFDTTASITGYYADGADTEERRNEFIAGRLALYDLEYIRFISQFRLSRAEQNTAFDAVALGVGVATTIVNGEHTKTILGAATTALTGLRASYEKNFYDDKTSVALVAQMTAERKKALVPILEGATEPVAKYPLTIALVDLTNYQFAGTIDGALAGVQQDAAKKDAAATAKIDSFRSVPYLPDALSVRIRNWLWPGWASADLYGTMRDADGAVIALREDRYARLLSEMEKLGLKDGMNSIAIPNLLSAKNLAAERSALVQALDIP